VRVSCISPGAVNTEFSTVRLGNKGDADKVCMCMCTARAPHVHWRLSCMLL
jgi:NADP-dependent 3-hydroxy acid dehydrogenase YdfG